VEAKFSKTVQEGGDFTISSARKRKGGGGNLWARANPKNKLLFWNTKKATKGPGHNGKNKGGRAGTGKGERAYYSGGNRKKKRVACGAGKKRRGGKWGVTNGEGRALARKKETKACQKTWGGQGIMDTIAKGIAKKGWGEKPHVPPA